MGKRIHLGCGKACCIERNSCISLVGVPVAMNSLLVHVSFNSRLPLCVAIVSCIWKTFHICPIMSMLKVAIHSDCACDGVGVGFTGTSDVDVAVWSSVFRPLVVWLSDASLIVGLRY